MPPLRPTSQPQTSLLTTSARPRDSSQGYAWLIERTQPRMTRPLRSAPITGASSLLRAGPPASPAPVLGPSRFPPLGTLPFSTLAGPTYRDPPPHVPRESSTS